MCLLRCFSWSLRAGSGPRRRKDRLRQDLGLPSPWFREAQAPAERGLCVRWLARICAFSGCARKLKKAQEVDTKKGPRPPVPSMLAKNAPGCFAPPRPALLCMTPTRELCLGDHFKVGETLTSGP